MLIKTLFTVLLGMIHPNSTIHVPKATQGVTAQSAALADDPYPACFPVSGDSPPETR